MTECTNATHLEEHQKNKKQEFFLSPVEKHISAMASES